MTGPEQKDAPASASCLSHLFCYFSEKSTLCLDHTDLKLLDSVQILIKGSAGLCHLLAVTCAAQSLRRN